MLIIMKKKTKKKHTHTQKPQTVRTIVIKVLIAACIPLELKRGHLTARRSIPHVDFSEPSAIGMEAQVNVKHQLRGLLPDLLNKRMNTSTCNKSSTSFYSKYVVRQMILVLIVSFLK